MKPVTVIIPMRNCEKYIHTALESVDFNLAECIVVDDFSEDGSVSLVKRYPVKLIKQFTHCGQGVGKNIGLDFALNELRTPYIMFLDADDYYSPNAIEKMLEAVRNHSCAVCNTRTFGDFKRDYGKLTLEGSFELTQSISMKTPVVAWNKIYTSESLRNVRFSRSIPEDNPFWFTYCCANEHKPINYISDVLCNYRQIETSSYNKQNRGANEFCNPLESYLYMYDWLKTHKPRPDLIHWLEESYLGNMVKLHNKITGEPIEKILSFIYKHIGEK